MSPQKACACWVQIAQFSFALPPADQMEKLSRWMAAAMVFIDLLGNYKMKPEQKVHRLSPKPSLLTETYKHRGSNSHLLQSGTLRTPPSYDSSTEIRP